MLVNLLLDKFESRRKLDITGLTTLQHSVLDVTASNSVVLDIDFVQLSAIS